MGSAEKIVELMKTMDEKQLADVLGFAESLLTSSKPELADAWAMFDKYAGRGSGKFNREECYDRKVLR